MKTMNQIISTDKAPAAVGSIQDLLQQVSGERIRRDLFYLCRDLLPFRKVNYASRPEHGLAGRGGQFHLRPT